MAVAGPTLSNSFNVAMCDHFGLKRVIDAKVNHERDEVFSVTLTVALTAADLAAIAIRMLEQGK